MSQAFDLASLTAVKFQGADCAKVMLNGVRIWERYTATRQVLVSSGYNTASWQHWRRLAPVWKQGNNNNYPVDNMFGFNDGNHIFWFSAVAAGYGQSGQRPPNPYYKSGYQFRRGANFWWNRRGNNAAYYIEQYREVNTWTDTSSYQPENYTAYYF